MRKLIFLGFLLCSVSASSHPRCLSLWGGAAAVTLLSTTATIAQTAEQASRAAHLNFNEQGQVQMSICAASDSSGIVASRFARLLQDSGITSQVLNTENATQTFELLRTGECQASIAPLSALEGQVKTLNPPVRPYRLLKEISRPYLNLLCERQTNVQRIRDMSDWRDQTIYIGQFDIDTADALQGLKALRPEFQRINVIPTRGIDEDQRQNILSVAERARGCGAWLSQKVDSVLAAVKSALAQRFQLVDLFYLGSDSNVWYDSEHTTIRFTKYSTLIPGQPDLYSRFRQTNVNVSELLSAPDVQDSYTAVLPIVFVVNEVWYENLERHLKRTNSERSWAQAVEQLTQEMNPP